MKGRYVVWVDNYKNGNSWEPVASYDHKADAEAYIEYYMFDDYAYVEDTENN